MRRLISSVGRASDSKSESRQFKPGIGHTEFFAPLITSKELKGRRSNQSRCLCDVVGIENVE